MRKHMKFQKKLTILVLLFPLLVFSQDVQTLSDKAADAYRAKNYKQSAELYVAALEKEENKSGLAYNAACSFALAGQAEKAFEYLETAVDLGYTNVEQIKSDSDLKSLHNDKRWQKIIDKAAEKKRAVKEFWDSSVLETPYRENISEDEKIAGLSKLWAEVKFNFTNFDLVPEVNWDALYFEYLPKVRQSRSTLEYYQLLMEIVAKLRDGHTGISIPRELVEQAFSRPPLDTRLIEDKVIITKIYDAALKETGLEIGQEIIEIDGIPIKKYASENVAPFQAASTPQDLTSRTYGYNLIKGKAGNRVKLTVKDETGKSRIITVQHFGSEEWSRFLKGVSTPVFEFKVLPGNIGYVALNSFGSNEAAEKFEENFEAISQTDALILDIRNNGGGNSSVGWLILSMLTDKPFLVSKWHTREYRPSFRAWGRPEGKYGEDFNKFSADGSKYYKKTVIVLTSPRTYSAAEDFAVAFDAMDRGLMIGEATGGSTGQPLFFRLPGGGSARVTTKRDSYPDGREFVGVGIQPDIKVSPTVKDFRTGRDTILEAAQSEIKKKL